MYMMVFLTLFVFIDNGLRTAFGAAVGTVFDPLIGFGGKYPLITLLLAGSFTTIISSVSRHVFTDWVKTTKVNQRLRALQKAQMEAMRRGNPGKVAKLKELSFEIRAESTDVQVQQLKPLAFTFLPFIVFFAWLSSWFAEFVIGQGHVFVAVPWSYQASLLATYAIFPGWLLLYIVLAIPIGQIVARGLKLVSFRKKLAALEAKGEAG